MAASLLISIIGYVLLMTIDLENTAVTYFAIFMATVGVSALASHKTWLIQHPFHLPSD